MEEYKFDNMKKNAFIAKYRSTLGNITASCEAAGVARQTYYDWKATDENFAQVVKNIDEESLDFAESSLKQQIKNGDTTATIFYLKTKGKSRGYVEKQELSFDIPVKLVDFGSGE